jgi:hypothetical protein
MAGYRRGEESYRIPIAEISVKDFGAKADDGHDDTDAFLRAIHAGKGKTIVVPAGRYHIDRPLEFHQSGTVLRGAGSTQTLLVFSRGLEDIEPRPLKNDGGTETSDWSWRGGFVRVGSEIKGTARFPSHGSPLTQGAKRGDREIILQQNDFRVGDELVLHLRDDEHSSLVDYLYRGKSGDTRGLKGWTCRQIFRVRKIEGMRLTLDRPLRFDVRMEWSPTLTPFTPEVMDVGIEGIGFEFPAVLYPGHFRERGMNPLTFLATAAHCWARDIHVRNGDNGPFIEGAAFCTLENIVLSADAARIDRHGHTGHHGITIMGDDCLCRGFDLQARFIHDLTVQSAIGSVFASGRAPDLAIDHHRWAPYENLFTHIDAGEGTRLFESSGGGNRGLHTAAGATFWNIRTKRRPAWPSHLGPDQIQVVAVALNAPESTSSEGRWFENIPATEIIPQDLHSAMAAAARAAVANAATIKTEPSPPD